jgi:hypothetical protein
MNTSYSGSKSRSTSYDTSQKQYLDSALNIYGGQLGKNPNVYGGERVAGPTPAETGAFDFANKGGFTTTPNQTADYFNSTIKNPAIQNFSKSTLPAVKEANAGPGYWGSARANQESLAGQNLNDQLNQSWGKLNWDTLQSNRTGALQQLGVGKEQQAQNQAQIDAQIQKFTEEHQITDPTNLKILMTLLNRNMSASTSAAHAQSFGLEW